MGQKMGQSTNIRFSAAVGRCCKQHQRMGKDTWILKQHERSWVYEHVIKYEKPSVSDKLRVQYKIHGEIFYKFRNHR